MKKRRIIKNSSSQSVQHAADRKTSAGEQSPASLSLKGSGGSARGAFYALLLLLLAGCLVYANNLKGEFIFDDFVAIVDNQDVHSLWPPWPLLKPAPDTPLSARPVAALTFALNYFLGGLDVTGYHLVNNCIHILAALLLFGLVRATLLLPKFRKRHGYRANILSLTVSMLWLVHPLNTEAVNYIVQRTELLTALFYLLTLYFSRLGFMAQRPVPWLAGAVISCALGMASKEVMVSAPLLVLLYDRLFVTGSFRAALTRRKIFYVLLAATWLILLYYQLDSPRRDSVRLDYREITVLDYLRTQVTVVFHYLRLAIWPVPLVPGLALMGLAALSGYGVVKGRWWSFPGVWFFFILAPTSSFVPILTEIVAERRMYLPLMAVVVFVVFCANEMWRICSAKMSRERVVAQSFPVLLFFFIIPVLGYMTWSRNHDYRTAVVIWQDTVQKRPGNYRAHENLGKALIREGRRAESVESFREAIRLFPSGAADPVLYVNLSAALEDNGLSAEAAGMLEKAVAIAPQDASLHYNLGNSYMRLNDPERAIEAYRKALAIAPDHYKAHGNLARAFLQTGELEAAEEHINTLFSLAPPNSPALLLLADLRIAQGRLQEAEALLTGTQRKLTADIAIQRKLEEVILLRNRKGEQGK